MSKNLFARAFGDESEDESTPRAAGAVGAQATEETNVSDGASACEVLCTACNSETCAVSKMLRHKAEVAKLPDNFRWLAEDPRSWADIQEEEDRRNPRPVDPWILELLALAAQKLETAADPEPIITIPFVENTDVWARNPNGSIICCRCHAHEGVKGRLSPACTKLIVNADGNNEERAFEAGCEKFDASELCTLSKGSQAGKRVAHIGEPEWAEAEPKAAFDWSRPATAGDWRSGASTPQQNWRSGAATPTPAQRPCCSNPLCRLPSGAQMTNHTLATCGKKGGGAYKGRK
jgi:hypothetical protein